ncbi:hypothetical protein BJ742DRAFT_777722 [Cladochytrium replicatum]|nr:hypothetical protein BJ742DRAFT_777722 [Cladochytrium replicatum]
MPLVNAPFSVFLMVLVYCVPSAVILYMMPVDGLIHDICERATAFHSEPTEPLSDDLRRFPGDFNSGNFMDDSYTEGFPTDKSVPDPTGASATTVDLPLKPAKGDSRAQNDDQFNHKSSID